MAVAFLAGSVDGIPEESSFADLTVISLSVKLAVQADSSVMVTVASSIELPVAIAIAWLTLAPGQLRMTEVVVSALVTLIPNILRIAFTDRQSGGLIVGASVSKGLSRFLGVRAQARPAWN